MLSSCFCCFLFFSLTLCILTIVDRISIYFIIIIIFYLFTYFKYTNQKKNKKAIAIERERKRFEWQKKGVKTEQMHAAHLLATYQNEQFFGILRSYTFWIIKKIIKSRHNSVKLRQTVRLIWIQLNVYVSRYQLKIRGELSVLSQFNFLRRRDTDWRPTHRLRSCFIVYFSFYFWSLSAIEQHQQLCDHWKSWTHLRARVIRINTNDRIPVPFDLHRMLLFLSIHSTSKLSFERFPSHVHITSLLLLNQPRKS